MLASIISARSHAEDRSFLRVVSVHKGNWDSYIYTTKRGGFRCRTTESV
jgi:hypothetical protein